MNQLSIWQRVHTVLRETTNERQYKTWLESTSLEGVEDGALGKILRIGVPGPFYKDWISNNFMTCLEKAVSTEFPGPLQIELVICQKTEEKQVDAPKAVTIEEARGNAIAQAPASQGGEETAPRRDVLNPQYTFGSFVVGPGNEFAHAACHSISEKPGKGANPVFICGPSGTGKTHLLNAVGNAVKEKYPHMRICYVSGERFLNDVVMGIRRKQMDKFHQHYREMYDLLIVDDIHVIARTNSTQEEFFHTFNAFYEAGKQVIVASDKLPKEMDGLEDRIRTRLEWGLTADIQPPDLETRMAILRYKAERAGISVPDEVVSLIAQISKRSVRELEGNLSTLKIYSELRGVPITVELARDVFSATIEQQKAGLTMDELIKHVAEHFGLSSRDLKSETRVKTVVRPRQIAMYLARKILGAGYVDIGRAFGNRDHTTVMHAEEKVGTLIQDDLDFRSEVNRLENNINNSQWTGL
ncbi:MAG: chromosomal replication initiator protein DnaA [Oligoflexia bacterium]|nr:chromosomal replication initiator protein DnaA [Oligoflexia bacterium]